MTRNLANRTPPPKLHGYGRDAISSSTYRDVYSRTCCFARLDSRKSRAALSMPGYACSLSPNSISTSFLALVSGQYGRPGPFGLPVFAKLTQYADIASASLRSSSDQSYGLVSRLWNTYSSSAE